jgi:hypothetical protein
LKNIYQFYILKTNFSNNFRAKMSSSTFYASTSAGPSNASSSSSSSGIPILPPLRCPLCPIHVHFPHDLALEAHLAQIHLGLRPFKCLECPPAAGLTNVDAITFPTEWAFLDHLAYTHGQYSGQVGRKGNIFGVRLSNIFILFKLVQN